MLYSIPGITGCKLSSQGRFGPQDPEHRGGLDNGSGVLLQGLRREFSDGRAITGERVGESPH
jgi:hypothetical protein